jgi:hypothetical protein
MQRQPKSQPTAPEIAKALQIAGSYLGTMKRSPLKPRPLPEEVQHAYSILGRRQACGGITDKDRSAGGKTTSSSPKVIAKRAMAATKRSAMARVISLDTSSFSETAKLRVRVCKNKTTGRSWSQVSLDAEGWRYRVSAGKCQRHHLKPSGPWEPIPPEAITSLPPYVRRFLAHMASA